MSYTDSDVYIMQELTFRWDVLLVFAYAAWRSCGLIGDGGNTMQLVSWTCLIVIQDTKLLCWLHSGLRVH